MTRKKRKTKADLNAIGDHGEKIFAMRISQHHMFSVYFLGDKAPIVDFLLEINDSKTPFAFMVQVKSTEKALGKSKTLGVKVSKEKYKGLLRRPLPTYIAGVDIPNETVYLCSAFKDKTHLPSMPTKYCLKFSRPKSTLNTLNLLKQDVIRYWKDARIANHKKKFVSSL